MSARSFEERLDRLQWQPGQGPTQQVIDSMLAPASAPRSVTAYLAGGVSGTVIGLGMKGMQAAAMPWGASLAGSAAGQAIVLAFLASPVLAVAGALLHRRFPWLMRFGAMNLLVIVAALLS